MSFVATAIIGGIGAAGSITGAAISSSAAGSAADKQAKSASAATAEERRQYDLARGDLAPYRTTGAAALNRLQTLMGLEPTDPNAEKRTELNTKIANIKSQLDTINASKTSGLIGKSVNATQRQALQMQLNDLTNELNSLPAAPAPSTTQSADFGALTKPYTAEDLLTDPSYQFRVSEGQKGVERTAAAKTGTLSGAATKAMQEFGQNMASTEYQNAWGRKQTEQSNLYGRLQQLAGMGESAAGTGANLGVATGQNIASNITGAGNAAAAANLASGANWSNALSGIGSNVSSMLQLQQLLRQSGYSNTLPVTNVQPALNYDYMNLA